MSVLTVGLNRILMPFSQTAVQLLRGVLQAAELPVHAGLRPEQRAHPHDRLQLRREEPRAHRAHHALRAFSGARHHGRGARCCSSSAPCRCCGLFDASDAMLAIGVPGIRIISVSFCLAGASGHPVRLYAGAGPRQRIAGCCAAAAARWSSCPRRSRWRASASARCGSPSRWPRRSGSPPRRCCTGGSPAGCSAECLSRFHNFVTIFPLFLCSLRHIIESQNREGVPLSPAALRAPNARR